MNNKSVKRKVDTEDRDALDSILLISSFIDLYGDFLSHSTYSGGKDTSICHAAGRILGAAHKRLTETLSGIDSFWFSDSEKGVEGANVVDSSLPLTKETH